MTDLHADLLCPDPWPSWVKRMIWAALGILVIICGLYGWSCVVRSRSDAHQTAANQAHESSVIHAAQASTYIAQAEIQKPVLVANTKAVAKAQAEAKAALDEVDRLRVEAALSAVDSEELSKAKDIAINALKTEVKAWAVKSGGLEAQLETVTRAYDAQTLALRDSGREALQLRASLAAKEGLIKAAELKGFGKGLLIGGLAGGGGGYIAGRLQ